MSKDAQFEFNVSDSLVLPLRGRLLRLRLRNGSAPVAAVAVGRKLIVRAPDGRERTIRILDHALTGGAVTQGRMDKTRELDIVVTAEDGILDGDPIDIGWTVRGPAE